MEQKNGQPEEASGYKFIQEKVVPKRKSKLKRFLCGLMTTLVFAVVFGAVARIVFLQSEDLFCRLLGIEKTAAEKKQVELNQTTPSATPTPTAVPTETPTPIAPTPTTGADSEPPVASPTLLSVTPQPIEVVQPTAEPIKIEATREDYIAMYGDLRRLAAQVSASLVTVTAVENGINWFEEEYENRSVTTGIIIGDNNLELLILVALDSISGASRTEVTLAGAVTLSATLVSYDSAHNLAVISVPNAKIPESYREQLLPAEFGDSYYTSVMTPVLLIGNQNGIIGSTELGLITSKGCYTYVTDNRLDLFTTDLSVGESGGVVVNLEGQIVGLINSSLGTVYNSAGLVVEETEPLCFVTGISRLKPVINALANNSDRVYFGIRAEDIPESVLQSLELESGIYVTEVVNGSPAFLAGLKNGDILTAVNGNEIISVINFSSELWKYQARETVTVTVQRTILQEQRELKLQVTLGKQE